MKRMKLLLTAMTLVAIVALIVGCPNESDPPTTTPTVETPTITIPEGTDADAFDYSTNIILRVKQSE